MVVVPTYNHGRTVTSVARALLALSLPVIVVNDGSTDATREGLEELEREARGADLTILHHERNRGKAEALRSGFAEAARGGRRTHVVTIDSDGQHDPADVPRLLEVSRAQPRALVLGTRELDLAGCPAHCKVGRTYTTLAIYAQTGRRLSDTQCGLRVYPLELVERVRCRAGRYAFEAEILTRALWAGYEIVEAPIWCSYQPEQGRTSHYRPTVDSLRQVGTHIRLLLRRLAPLPQRLRRNDAGAQRRNRLRRFWAWLNPFKCWQDVRHTQMGTIECAAGLGLGAWIGTLPFFGAHTAICLFTAWRFSLRPATLVLGSQVSVPPLGVLLALVSTATGHLLLTGALPTPQELGAEGSLVPHMAWRWLPAWLLGSVVVGFVLGMAVFGAALVLLSPLAKRTAKTAQPRVATADDPGAAA